MTPRSGVAQDPVVGGTGTDLARAIAVDVSRPGYRFGTVRAVPPEVTLRRILPLMAVAGITRLADVTGLDWLGIPVYQAVRPNSRNISVSQGKGVTAAQAKVSALMESLEGFHAEELRDPGMRATLGSLRGELPYSPESLATAAVVNGPVPLRLDYDPYALPIGPCPLLRDDVPIDWVPATDLSSGAPTWLPRQLCTLDLRVRERLSVPLFRATSNGLASGNTISEAIVHGLCEVVERDSMFRVQATRFAPQRAVAPGSVSARLPRQVLDRVTEGGCTVHIVDSTGPTHVPCFQAYLRHAESSSRHFGAGCHPNRATALVRAITEAAQSRLAHIAGSRDDILRRSYGVALGSGWDRSPEPFPATHARSFDEVPTMRVDTWGGVLEELVRRVHEVTGQPPLAVDLTRPEVGLPVVIVVAPGLHLLPPARR